MIRRILRGLRDRLVTKLTPRESHPRAGRPTETWIWKMRRDFKKQRLINPDTGRLDLKFNPLAIEDDINCPCHYTGGHRIPGCPFHPEENDPSEELAFLEWLERKGINLPEKDILRNDDKWRGYNPMSNDKDFYIPQRDVTCPRHEASGRALVANSSVA